MLIFIIRFTICAAFYIIGAYATTDILRLLKGNPTSVSSSDCFCEHCGYKIPLRQQIPVFSYLLNRGTCRNCKNPIPAGNFILEIFFMTVFTAAALITQFSAAAWLFCILFYETVKLFCIICWGKRGSVLITGLLSSLLGNIVNFSLLGILFFLHALVMTV